MDVKAFFDTIGGGYEDALGRFGSDKMIALFITKYAKDKTFDGLVAAVASGDIKASFGAAHALKGVAGNMGFEKLYADAYALTEQLRPQSAAADSALYQAVCAQQERILAAAKQYIG